MVSAGEARPAATRCRQCDKPIIWPGLCYTCATGLPRKLRPLESERPIVPGEVKEEPRGRA